MTILIENIAASDANLLIESVGEGDKKSFYMQGIFIQGNVKNFNGRVYPRHEIERAVKSLNARITKGESVMGEVDHPNNLTINLDRVSHVITEMRMQGADGVGKLKVFNGMPMGRICRSLLEEGVKLGVSSRGTGEVGSDGNVMNFDIVTVDIVAQPSAPDAYPRAILEAMEHYRNRSVLLDTANCMDHDAVACKYYKKTVIDFIQSLQA